MQKDIEDIAAPSEPSPGECCGNGCARCVWDVYYDNLAAWQLRKSAAKQDAAPSLPAKTVCADAPVSSYTGSVVLKFVEGGEYDACDEWGVPLPVDHAEALWKRDMIAVDSITDEAETTSSSLRLFDIHLKGSIPSNLLQQHRPGDVVEILVPNDEEEVSQLCQSFKISPDRLCHLGVSPFVRPDCFPPWLPQRRILKVRELLRCYVDLNSSAYLHRPFFSLLAKSCKEPAAAKESLDRLSLDMKLQSNEVAKSLPSLSNIFAAFPTAVPPLAKFLEVSAPLRARKFTVTRMVSDRQFQLCMRLVESQRELPSMFALPLVPLTRYGHVSGPVFQRSRANEAWCRFGRSGAASAIPLTYTSRNLLMIVAGSGVAPALAILSSSMADKRRWLLFGARTSVEVAAVLQSRPNGSLHTSQLCTRVDVAVSREPTSGARHLPELMLQHRTEIRSFIVDERAAVLSCGPNKFIDAVRTTLEGILFPIDDDIKDERMQQQRMTFMVEAGNIHFEEWNTIAKQ